MQINPLRHILVARDFSPSSEQALAWGIELARRTGATLHLLYAEVLHADPFGQRQAEAAEEARRRLGQDADGQPLEEAHEMAGLPVRHAVVREIAAAPAIVRYAEEHDIDLVVMGTHGRRGVSRMLLGSVAAEVVRASPCSVLTVREGAGAGRIGAVLAPVDFSELSKRALRRARELAELLEARLDVLHVVGLTPYPSFYDADVVSLYDMPPRFAEEAERHLRAFYEEAGGPEPPEVAFAVMAGQAFRQVARFAERHGSGLIVMGTRGLTGLQHFLIGSTAERTLALAPCPVLVVKRKGAPEEAPPEEPPAEAAARNS